MMMGPRDVRDVRRVLSAAGVSVWIDGGWGIDALLGEQTRPHDDLDLVINIENVRKAQQSLQSAGFRISANEMPTRFVCRDQRDRRIDFHPVTFDSRGNGAQQLPDGTIGHYPRDGLSGTGSIDGISVRCLTPELQTIHHCGYEPDTTDHHDMHLLRNHFGVVLPPPYRERDPSTGAA